jgi:chaperonin GroES
MVNQREAFSAWTCRARLSPGPAAGRERYPEKGLQEEPSVATATKAKPVRASKPTTHAVAAPIAKKLRPLGDRVVVRPTPAEETTKSGIVIPDTAKEKPQEGTILAVGPGRVLDDGKHEQIDLKRGDKVLYAKYAGTEFKLDGEDLLIIGHKDILAVVESRP